MLKVENLSTMVGGKPILKDVNLTIKDGQVHALLGPNGSGKTTLLMAIMGMPRYKVTAGRILFKGKDITSATIDERARLGIGLTFQRAPVVRGVKTRQMVEICLRRQDATEIEKLAESLNLTEMLDRDINAGFSGGEAKRAEMLQLLAQNPDFAMFDEPESGVDLDNMAVVGGAMADILQKDKMRNRTKAGLIVTHTGHILDFVNADYGHVFMHGTIVCQGNPRDLFADIKANGYEECVRCRRCL
ncbi:MAG: ABC transporter ATP-binding protein [Actinomycetota bacterium]